VKNVDKSKIYSGPNSTEEKKIVIVNYHVYFVQACYKYILGCQTVYRLPTYRPTCHSKYSILQRVIYNTTV